MINDTFYLSLAWLEAYLEQSRRYVLMHITTWERVFVDLEDRVVEERRRRG
jgi:hypothetical protein